MSKRHEQAGREESGATSPSHHLEDMKVAQPSIQSSFCRVGGQLGLQSSPHCINIQVQGLQSSPHCINIKVQMPTDIEDEEVEVDEGRVDDEGADALQLAHNGAGVLQGEGQVLALLQGRIASFTTQLRKAHVA